ncbi:MAG: hypothetical protein OCC49_13565 [Fibrobacterales bacterium]
MQIKSFFVLVLVLVSLGSAGNLYISPGVQYTTITTDRIVYPQYVPGVSFSVGYEFKTTEHYHLALSSRYISSGYGWSNHTGSVESTVRSHAIGAGIINRWIIKSFDIVFGLGYMQLLSLKDNEGNPIKHKKHGIQSHSGIGYRLFSWLSLRLLYTWESYYFYNKNPGWGRGYTPHGFRLEWCVYI